MMGEKKEVVKSFFLSVKEYFFIILGILAAGFGLKGFLIPSGLIDGGITGVSLLIHFLSSVSVSLLIFVINIPFIFLAFKQVGKTFAIKTSIAITGLAILLLFVEFPIITSDRLLVAVFGGFFLGAGIGLSMRGGGVLDGTEVLSVYLSKKINLSVGEVLFGINVVIFAFAAFFLSVETALYSILIYLTASKTMDFIITGIEEYIGISVISKKSNEIRKSLINDFKKGVTIYKGKGGYSEGDPNHTDIDIIYTILTRFEVTRIKGVIKKIDPSALIIEQGLNEVSGGRVKQRPLH